MNRIDLCIAGLSAASASALGYVGYRTYASATEGDSFASVREWHFSLLDRDGNQEINLDRSLPVHELEVVSGRRKRWRTDYSARLDAVDAAGKRDGRVTAAEYEQFLRGFDRNGDQRLTTGEAAAIDARHATRRVNAWAPFGRT